MATEGGFAPERALVQSDGDTSGAGAFIELEIDRGRLQAIVDEAGVVLMRTAFSTIVRESKDFTCAILTIDGGTVVQSAQSIPAFLGTITHTAREILTQYSLAEWKPGDIIGTNDPWLGTGHLFDLTLFAPVFVDGKIVALAGVVAHLPDVGGRGRDAAAAEIFEEGLRVPPIRFASNQGLDVALSRLIQANVRLPEQVMGDISALLNSLGKIAERLASLCAEITIERFHYTCRELAKRTEAYMRNAILTIPDGTYQSILAAERIGHLSFTVKLHVTIEGDRVLVDFAGSSPQVPAGVNVALSFTTAYTVYGLKCLLAPALPLNEGIFAPIQVIAPAGSIVNSRFPAAGSARSSVGHFIPTLLFDALAEVVPHDCIAECGAPRPLLNLRGTDTDRGAFSPLIIAAGGFGARSTKDGPSCLAFPTNTECAPIEMIEATAPVLFREKELITDSGGAGLFRGGLGQRVVVECLADHAEAFVRAQRLRRPAKGILGGRPGGLAAIIVNGKAVYSPLRKIRLRKGDTIAIHSPGGGGYGTPTSRARDLVTEDVQNGYVSSEKAVALYGAQLEKGAVKEGVGDD
ncbi:MAG TPA: hydantoinase B/oxoprolinase family protein [bacterium]|nr:hydantoinase B/oxoprolinase family protein [bacterium]